MRARGVAMFAVATIVAVAGCKKGAGGGKPFMQRELETQHQVLQDVELDIKLPAGMKAETKGTEVQWIASADDTLEVTIQLATPTVMQNAINFEDQAGRRISRSDQAADGWVVTANDASGGFLLGKRMIQKDNRALFCSASMSWKHPGFDPKRTEFVESICGSMVATKF